MCVRSTTGSGRTASRHGRTHFVGARGTTRPPTLDGWCDMSRRVASVIVALALLPVLASAVLAAGEGGAHMRPPKIEMKPAPGKLIELSVTVGFTGGCCFTLTTHNIAAALEVPPEVQVVNGPDPARYDQIVGPPGGVKQGIAEFRWRLKKAKEDAVYPIKVRITTSDSGTVEKEYTLTKPVLSNNSSVLPGRMSAGSSMG